ncbi:MAG: putative ABC transporter permease [Clostridia bacterium]|nr:putative ABC transporter permease [Clostridia bacterium]MBQ9945212.1 putative ABC transporter permease [Clostridia bacterium]
MFDVIIDYVFMFFVFSAIGWAIECTYRSLGERRIINSGFLYGPMCPIYGTGCLVFDIILVPLSEPIEKRLIIVLLLGMLLADIVEYVTSYIMEKLFNARWWDYSNNFLNLHGRICFKHTCYWAIFAFVYVYLIAPMYRFALGFISQEVRVIAVFVILAIFTVDLIFTVKAAADINKLMKKLSALKVSVMEKAEQFKDTAESTYEELRSGTEKLTEWKNDINRQYYDIVAKYEELASKGPKSRLMSIYSTMRKAADDSIREIESKWNDIKAFFIDSDDEMM